MRMFKVCPSCELARHDSEYTRRRVNQLSSNCIECNKAYQKEKYESSALEIIRLRSSNKLIRISKRKFVTQQKDNPCADCGHRFPAVSMDFDHVRGTKLFNISESVHKKSIDEIAEEMAKCDLVCANCHRVRTQQRARGKKLTNDGNDPTPSKDS
jgi:hypothetical protein